MSAELFGKFVKVHREAYQLSVRQLAIDLDVSPTTVTNIEGGKTKDPRLSIIKKWSKRFNVDLVFLVNVFDS